MWLPRCFDLSPCTHGNADMGCVFYLLNITMIVIIKETARIVVAQNATKSIINNCNSICSIISTTSLLYVCEMATTFCYSYFQNGLYIYYYKMSMIFSKIFEHFFDIFYTKNEE